MSNDITNQVRAKSVSIATERTPKGGQNKPVKTRNHIIPLKGMATAKEAEKMGIDMAKELGVSEDRIIVETYQKGEAPIEANPRHRGSGHHWDNRTSKPMEVIKRPFIRARSLFGGVDLPKNEEEKQLLIAEFEARKALL